MPHLFRPYADTIARTVLVATLVVPFAAIAAGYWLSASPYETEQTVTVDQPVPFSHEHHVGGLGLDCRYCHTGVETSPVAGMPPTHTCMTCHSQLYTQAAMLAPVRESLAENKPIHWNKVNRLPDYVYFDHSIHIAKGVGCTTCHGPVATMPLMRQAAPLTMGWCLIAIAIPRRICVPLPKCSIPTGKRRPIRTSGELFSPTKTSTTSISPTARYATDEQAFAFRSGELAPAAERRGRSPRGPEAVRQRRCAWRSPPAAARPKRSCPMSTFRTA